MSKFIKPQLAPAVRDLENLTSRPLGEKLPEEKEIIFESNKSIENRVKNQIEYILPELLLPNTQHTNTLNQKTLKELVPSIQENGILSPVIVRIHPNKRGSYEIISGHHRTEIAKRLHILVPCIIQNVSDDMADIYYFDTNIQRDFDSMPPSQLAKAIKKKHEAERRQGQRTDLVKKVEELKDDEPSEPAEDGFSLKPRTVSRYLRVAELTDGLLARLDKKQLKLRPAEVISYLRTEEQLLLDELLEEGFQLDTAKAQALKEKSAVKPLRKEQMEMLLADEVEEPTKKQVLSLKISDLEAHGCIDMKPREIKKYILEALNFYRDHIDEYLSEGQNDEAAV